MTMDTHTRATGPTGSAHASNSLLIAHFPRGPIRLVALAAVLGVAAAATPAALAVARVGLGATGNLTVAVDPGGGANDNHGLQIGPFVGLTGNGFRVRQDASGRPSITTGDVEDCRENPFFNDVVCNGPRGSASVTTRGGNDRVILHDDPLPDCIPTPVFPTPPPVLQATLDLGAGADDLNVIGLQGCDPARTFVAQVQWSVDANGGDGNDVLRGETEPDTLRGGFGNDTLEGRGGNDDLRGESGVDTLRGGPGNDELDGGVGDDVLEGGDGADLVDGGGSADTLRGGPGNDELDGGLGDDVLRGNDGADELLGVAGSNDLFGDGGNDTLRGGTGSDNLVGGSGRDTLNGGGGNDQIDARDAELDTISCGGGDDRLAIDLVDPAPADCEQVRRFAVDDGPPGHAVGRTVRLDANGTATVAIACPRPARIACRGALTARLGHPRGQVIGRARYSARLGGRTTVTLPLGRRPRGTRIFLETRERGVSRKGPRTAVMLFRVR